MSILEEIDNRHYIVNTLLEPPVTFFGIGALFIAMAYEILVFIVCTVISKDYENQIRYALTAIFVISAIAFVVFVVGAAYGEFPASSKYSVSETRQMISSLQDTSTTEGKFFIGCGDVYGKSYYYFYRKDGNKYSLDKISTDTTDIIQDENKSPYLATFVRYETITKNNGNVIVTRDYYTIIRNEIHVPENTIKEKYVLDGV